MAQRDEPFSRLYNPRRDTDRLVRFQREAEVLASLNHPHIAAIKPDPEERITLATSSAAPNRLTDEASVVQNWHEELKRLVPTN